MPPDDLASRIEEFLLSLDLPADGRDYLDRHLRRLVQTLLRVPQSRSSGRALELGSYMHMAPVLHLFLGYRDVRGAYYGHAGESKTLASSVGGREVFRCVIDGFDVELDRFPYDDESMETVRAAGFTDVTMETERDETFDSEWVERILREQGLPTERRGEQQYCVARKTAPHAAPQRPHFLYDQ